MILNLMVSGYTLNLKLFKFTKKNLIKCKVIFDNWYNIG